MAAPKNATELSEALIHEVEAADVIVIGTPVNNFTVPSVLKAWIDQILRMGRTIMPTPSGKVGTLRDRPVFIAIASGGVFAGAGANQPDFFTPYLSAAFACVGLKTLQFLPVQATAFLDSDQIKGGEGITPEDTRPIYDWRRAMIDRGASRRSIITNIGLAASLLAMPRVAQAQAAASGEPMNTDGKMMVGMLVFDGFELLDVFGPLEMFGCLRDRVHIVMIGERDGQIASSAGPKVLVDCAIAKTPKLDVFMIPGGGGTRREVNNTHLIEAVKSLAERTPHVASICTGAAVLARTGLLDGKRATTNKRAFKWATSQGPAVQWVRQARWVEDGKYFTSSGISAGTDMAVALIDRLLGRETAQAVADDAEYRWNSDSTDDPFAKLNGLVN